MNVGLYSSVQGLLTAQRAVDVASHNLSNSETEGYSRQRAEQSANTPMGFNPYGQIGTGVKIDAINRIRDTLLDRQVRDQMSPLGESEARAEALGQIEEMLGEPGEAALTTNLAKYYDAWQKLSAAPENYSLRITLREAATNLANTFNRLFNDLQGIRQDLYDRINTKIDDINAKVQQIAELNREITASHTAGQNPNDLKDQQDLLVEQLSKMVDIQALVSPSSGATNVYVGGTPLVVETDAFKLAPAAINPLSDAAVVNFVGTGQPIPIRSGELQGMLDVRNVVLGVLAPTTAGQPNGLIFQLNTMAAQLIADTNALHQQGFGLDGSTTLDFFNGTDAATIAVNQNITNLANGLDLIAAAANDPGGLAGGPGDNGMALQIIQRRNALTLGGDPVAVPAIPPKESFESFWKRELTNVAVLGQSANRNTETRTTLVDSIRERRDQVSAVSSDEEMANVIRFQKAYAASAKMISTIDEMLDLLINMKR